MSESATTKSVADSTTTQTSGVEEISDRWTNNITYRQLVVSSCIGILQFWWHPYLQNPKAFVPFIFLYNIFSLLVGYPFLYLEIALGIVTRKGVLKCWDIAPFARGVGWSMLSTCAFTAFGLGIVSSYCLAMLVHSFHSFLPWLHCAAEVSVPCAARHRSLSVDSETPPQSFFNNFVLNLKRNGSETSMGSIVPELIIYHIISWIVIYFIAIRKIYSYSKMVFFKDSLGFLILMCSILGASRLDGAITMFTDCDWNILTEDPHIWRRALEFSLLELSISQGSMVMLGSYCPKARLPLSGIVVSTFFTSKLATLASAFVLGATHGALYKDYGGYSNVTSEPGAYSLMMWSDFVVRIPGSQFWSALVFFTLFVLSTSSTALIVQTLISALSGKTVSKISWAFLILTCILFCFIGCFTVCTQSGIIILDFLMYWPISMPRVPIAAVTAAVVTFVYGQTTFCEDVFFAVQEYPNVFLRVCWALCPVLLMGIFCAGMGFWPHKYKVAGWSLNILMLLPIVLVMLIYLIFRCRVRNIMRSEK